MMRQCKYCEEKINSVDKLIEHLVQAHHQVDLSIAEQRQIKSLEKKPSSQGQHEAGGSALSRRSALQFGVAGVGAAVGVGIGSRRVEGQQTGLTISDTLAGNLTPTDLVQNLLPSGGNINLDSASVQYAGASEAAGIFSGQIQATTSGNGESEFGFNDGIILGTGAVSDIEGPNDNADTTTEFDTAGDQDLDQFTSGDTTDAAVLEFEFDVPEEAQSIRFNYLFGSEEYNKYVFSPFNDVFAFFLNGSDPSDNVATINQTPTAINNLNHGFDGNVDPNDNDAEADTPVNPTLYVNNDTENGNNVHGSVDPENPPGLGIGFDPDQDPAPYDVEMDGFSVELAIDAPVDPADNPQEIKLAVADVADAQLDTWVREIKMMVAVMEGTKMEMTEMTTETMVEMTHWARVHLRLLK